MKLIFDISNPECDPELKNFTDSNEEFVKIIYTHMIDSYGDGCTGIMEGEDQNIYSQS